MSMAADQAIGFGQTGLIEPKTVRIPVERNAELIHKRQLADYAALIASQRSDDAE